MSWRRISWLAHNALMTPFIPIRVLLVLIFRLGQFADWSLGYVPGWRRYNGWGRE